MTDGSEAAAEHATRVRNIIRSRRETHGDALIQHDILASLWSDHLGVKISTTDAMYMLLLLKVSRIKSSGIAEQHMEDIAGYACLVLASLSRDTHQYHPENNT